MYKNSVSLYHIIFVNKKKLYLQFGIIFVYLYGDIQFNFNNAYTINFFYELQYMHVNKECV